MNVNSKVNFLKREKKRRLSKFGEYVILNVGWAVSLFIAILILLNSVDSQTDGGAGGVFYFGIAYLICAVIGFVLNIKMRFDIVNKNEVSTLVRRASLILIPFIVTGNFFIAIAGFSTAKKHRTIEYNLVFYALINCILIIIVSIINTYKAFVANTFFTGIYMLAGLTLFYLLIILMVSIFTVENGRYKYLRIPAILLILTGISGNLFGLALGLIILTKLRDMKTSRTTEWIDILRRVFKNYMAVIGLFVVVFLLTLSICSYLTFDYSIAIDNDYLAILRRPSLMYPFGTDEYGRCVFTRIVFGARISLTIGLLATFLPLLLGGMLGAIAGHFSTTFDNVIMRILDVLYAVPPILLAIAIVAAFGASTTNLILAMSVSMIPIYARTMRAQVMTITSNEFVEAARASGRNEYIILLKHIIPNSIAPMIVRATLSVGSAVLTTSGLSYLGLGVEPHIPEWGNILRGGTAYLETYSYLAIFPGLAIMLIVLAFNFFGDGLRDALDPKLK